VIYSCACCCCDHINATLVERSLTKSGAASAKKKVRLLAYTALGSFVFDFFKWFFQGPDYSCGFAVWPNLGPQALGEL